MQAKEVYIHVRLRSGKDNDLIAWYLDQADRSEAVREVIRVWIQRQNDSLQETAIKQELARLPELVTTAIHTALADVRLDDGASNTSVTKENPDLAARLDAQLDSFFED